VVTYGALHGAFQHRRNDGGAPQVSRACPQRGGACRQRGSDVVGDPKVDLLLERVHVLKAEIVGLLCTFGRGAVDLGEGGAARKQDQGQKSGAHRGGFRFWILGCSTAWRGAGARNLGLSVSIVEAVRGIGEKTQKHCIELNKRSGDDRNMARKTGSHADITGPRVRQAALKLFARFGYAAVSMRQIAGEVGMQAGALYTYTSDKQALLFDLMQGHMQELLTAWQETSKPADALDRLESFVRFHIDHHFDRPDAVFVAYMELRNLGPDNFARIEDLRRDYERALQEIIDAGLREGVFRVEDAKVTTLAVIAMLTGVNTWYCDGGRLSRAEIGDLYWQMVRRSVAVNDVLVTEPASADAYSAQ
jgi:AcrR family transcriptional regulator